MTHLHQEGRQGLPSERLFAGRSLTSTRFVVIGVIFVASFISVTFLFVRNDVRFADRAW